jgi:CarD family transcriptional regulator
MFDIGDVIIYSEHGLCQIDDICEKTFAGVTRTYYILHPLAQENLQISTPIDNNKVVMLRRWSERKQSNF